MVPLDARPQYLNPEGFDRRRLKNRARLTKQDRKKFLRQFSNGRCEISGEFVGKTSHVHHIKPRFDFGDKNIKNLAILDPEVHQKIHTYARELADDEMNESEWIQLLTRDAITLGKLSQTFERPEAVDEVYRRELRIEARDAVKQGLLEM